MTPEQPPMPAEPQPTMPGKDPMLRMEIVISNLLRAGVAISLVLIVIGSIVTFVRHPEFLKSREALPGLVHPEAVSINSPGAIVAGLRAWRGQAIVTLGLLVLIATPMLRVAVSVVAFFLQGDRLYMLITFSVFCLLMLSLALGAAE
jgi:uncharacterized membrane protein